MSVRRGSRRAANLRAAGRRFRRSRIAVALLASTAFVSVRAVVVRADAARARWGADVSVVVVARPVAAGDVVRAADLTVQRLPLALVPAASSTDAAKLIGRRARTDLERGDLVIAPRLVGGRSSVSARLRTGERAVAVRLEDAHPPLRPGDGVQLVLSGDDRVSLDAVVLVVDDQTLTVAVVSSEAPLLARAALNGPVAVVLR